MTSIELETKLREDLERIIMVINEDAIKVWGIIGVRELENNKQKQQEEEVKL